MTGWVTCFSRWFIPTTNLEPAGSWIKAFFVPPWQNRSTTGELIEALELWATPATRSLPESERNLYTFSYIGDRTTAISGQQLGQAVGDGCTLHPGAKAWLIGHSNGGIVSAGIIEKEGGVERVGRLFLLGSP